ALYVIALHEARPGALGGKSDLGVESRARDDPRRFGVAGQDRLGAAWADEAAAADAERQLLHARKQTDLFAQRQAARSQAAAAGLLARELVAIEKHDFVAALLGEQQRGGRTAGSGADYGDFHGRYSRIKSRLVSQRSKPRKSAQRRSVSPADRLDASHSTGLL